MRKVVSRLVTKYEMKVSRNPELLMANTIKALKEELGEPSGKTTIENDLSSYAVKVTVYGKDELASQQVDGSQDTLAVS